MSRHKPHTLRYQRVDCVREEDWQPLGLDWQSPANEAVIAHDLYHHLPEDAGTFREEVATLGAEYYINFERCRRLGRLPGLNELQHAASYVVTNTAQGAVDVESALSLPASLTKPLDPIAERIFAEVALTAYSEIPVLTDLPDEIFEPEEDGTNPYQVAFCNAFVGTMRQGYRQAKTRFPDRSRVRAAFKSLERDLFRLNASVAPIGTTLTLVRRGYDYQLEVTPAAAAA